MHKLRVFGLSKGTRKVNNLQITKLTVQDADMFRYNQQSTTIIDNGSVK